jgi:hypothetical protein
MMNESQREIASQRMKALWADPAVREARSLKARKDRPCLDCGVTARGLFYTYNNRRTNARCKECHKKRCSMLWHSKTQIEKQATRVKTMYGIEPEEYLKLHNAQKGKCAICGDEPKTKRGLHLDHCHETGKVRGLLCHGCNVALGSFKDSKVLLEKAINYLRSQ